MTWIQGVLMSSAWCGGTNWFATEGQSGSADISCFHHTTAKQHSKDADSKQHEDVKVAGDYEYKEATNRSRIFCIAQNNSNRLYLKSYNTEHNTVSCSDYQYNGTVASQVSKYMKIQAGLALDYDVYQALEFEMNATIFMSRKLIKLQIKSGQERADYRCTHFMNNSVPITGTYSRNLFLICFHWLKISNVFEWWENQIQEDIVPWTTRTNNYSNPLPLSKSSQQLIHIQENLSEWHYKMDNEQLRDVIFGLDKQTPIWHHKVCTLAIYHR